MIRHLVTFYSPGTFFSEETTKEIESWDISLAVEMSKNILERYDARPFAFRFSTQEMKDGEWQVREIKKSVTYWLGGDVYTLEQLQDRNDPEDEILIRNMINNHWGRVIINTNSWKHTGILGDDDVILEYSR